MVQTHRGLSGRAEVLAGLRERGIDGPQLLSRLGMSPDERLRHLEEFVGDMRALRRDVARSRARS
jgi:hypothetical protein